MELDTKKASEQVTWYSLHSEAVKLRTQARNQQIRFGGNRELVIQRDNEMCVTCGMTRIEHKEKYNADITVDHIDGTGRNDLPTNNDMDNLQTLCLPCHGRKDTVRKSPHIAKANSGSFKPGRIISEELREANRQRMLTNNPFKGKKHSEETRRIMSEKAKARKRNGK